jgi:glutamate--cysteine ligase
VATLTDPALLVPLRREEEGGLDDLLSIFRGAEKPASEFRIGAEMEKPGILKDTAASLPYDGPVSVLTILDELVKVHGWIPDRERPDGPLIALLRNHASVTLEPGGQLELSGAPVVTIHDVCSEFRAHMKELAPISSRLGIKWLGIGFHPFAKRSDLPMVPKDRYAIMSEYLPTKGKYALDMMLRTSTVQANFDYLDEADAMKKMRVGLKLSPLTTAMFANSPWLEGKPHGGVSYRAKVWTDVDNDRSGLVENCWREGAGYKDYAAWALSVPMFLFKRDGKVVKNTGQTFHSFWKDGFEGHRPTQGDWRTHLQTLFPEVRLKSTIEIRGADAQSSRLACALPALWTGIYYDTVALEAADAMTRDWTYAEVAAARAHVWEQGLKTPFRDGTFADIARQFLAIAEGGLERRGAKSPSGKDERVHLAPLRALVDIGKTPAETLLEAIDPRRDLVAQIVERTDLESGR